MATSSGGFDRGQYMVRTTECVSDRFGTLLLHVDAKEVMAIALGATCLLRNGFHDFAILACSLHIHMQAARRRALQDLLAADVNTALPVALSGALDLSATAELTQARGLRQLPPANTAPRGLDTSTTSSRIVKDFSRDVTSAGEVAQSMSRSFDLGGYTDDESDDFDQQPAIVPAGRRLAASGSTAKSSTAKPVAPPSAPATARSSVLAPSTAAKIASGRHVGGSPGLQQPTASSGRQAGPSGAITTSSTTSATPPSTGKLTYQQRLQLNARYSIHSRANDEAQSIAASKVAAGSSSGSTAVATSSPAAGQSLAAGAGADSAVHASSFSSSARPGSVSSLPAASPPVIPAAGAVYAALAAGGDNAPSGLLISPSRRSQQTSAAPVTFTDGTAAAQLLRSASPVVSNTAGSQDVSTASTSVLAAAAGSGAADGGASHRVAGASSPSPASGYADGRGLDDSIATAITAADEDEEEDDDVDGAGDGHDGGGGNRRSTATGGAGGRGGQSSPPLTVSPSPPRRGATLSASTSSSPPPSRFPLPAASSAAAGGGAAVAGVASTHDSSGVVGTGGTSPSVKPVRLFAAAAAGGSGDVNDDHDDAIAPTSLHQSSVDAFLRQLDDMDAQMGILSGTSMSGAPRQQLYDASGRVGAPAADDRLHSGDGGGGFVITAHPSSPGQGRYRSGNGAAGAGDTVPASASPASVAAGNRSMLRSQHQQQSSSPSSSSPPLRGVFSVLDLSGSSSMLNSGDGHGPAGAASAAGAPGAGAGADSGRPTSSASGAGSSTAYASIRSKVVAMTMEIEEKGRTIAIMRAQLVQARKVLKERESEAEQRAQQRLEQQREEVGGRINEHLSFIERLLEDKKQLATQVEALTSRLHEVSGEATHRIQSIEQRAQIELERVRDTILAQERQRRSAWQEQKIKEIKAQTLKGLEPDIQRLLDKHKQEIEQIQAACAEEISNAASQFAGERDNAISQALLAAAGDKDGALNYEKQQWRVREAQLREEYDKESATLRDRYRADVEEERRRAAAVARQDADRHLNELTRLQDEWQVKLNQLMGKHAEERAVAMRAVADAVAAEQAKHAADRERWESQLQIRIRSEVDAREREIRSESNRNRDDQLKLVIARFDADMQNERSKHKQESDSALGALREEGQRAVEGLKEQLSLWQAKCEELTRARDQAIASHGDAAVRLQSQLDDARQQVLEARHSIQQLSSTLESERSKASSDIDSLQQSIATLRAEHSAEVARLTSHVDTLAQQQREAETAAKQTLAHLNKQHSEELESLQARVSVAIRKRDEMIKALKGQVDEQRVKADTARRLLNEQRRDLQRQLGLADVTTTGSTDGGGRDDDDGSDDE